MQNVISKTHTQKQNNLESLTLNSEEIVTKQKLSKVMEKRLNVQIDCSKPVMTDQSYKNSCDINNIMKQYQKTKLLPSVREHLARYIDNTQVMPLEEAHAKIQHAQALFYELPSEIRKLMDNNPLKMQEVLENPVYKDLLVKTGVLTDNINTVSKGNQKEQEVQSPKSQADAVSKSE